MDYLSELIARANKALEVAKPLTTKQRKKMKKGTFCGPNRSFPVPDCKHVGTAKAFLKRSKFSASTKKKIAACINRKAKQLGCTPGKKAKAYIELSTEEKILYSSEIFQTTRDLVDESIKHPDFDPFGIEEVPEEDVETEKETEKHRECDCR
jgi:hypothetical protein